MARGAARRVPCARSSAGPEAPERHPHARTRRHRATRTSTATSRNRPAGYGPSSGIRINTAKITLAGQAGLRDGQWSAMARRKVGWRPGCQPDDLPKGYQLGFRGASLAPYGPAIMAGCPPEAELIGLRQVDGMAQRELRPRCRSIPGANAVAPAVTRQPGVT